MPINKKYLCKFEQSKYYHVYNRSNNNEDLFKCDEDRNVFLELISKFAKPYFKVVGYSLMDNHFHLVIKIKRESIIKATLRKTNPKTLKQIEKSFLENPKDIPINDLIINQFRRIFISYTKYLQVNYKRVGSLFQRPFKRKIVSDKSYLKRLILYVHFNSKKHEIPGEISAYKWSSHYKNPTKKTININQKHLYQIFGGRDNYIIAHSDSDKYLDYKGFDLYLINSS